jgi:integrase
MPSRREGPTKNKQTGYYFFDEYIGFPPSRKRVRYSLKTKDPAKARFLWEQEYRRQWAQYYGLETPERPREILFYDISDEYLDYEKNIKRIKEWRVIKGRLNLVKQLWGNIPLTKISKEHFVQLDDHLKKIGRTEFTINHYFSLLKALFNYAIREGKYRGENPIRQVKPYVVDEKRREYSPEEIKKIIEAAEKIEKEARPGAILQKYAKRIVLLLFYTGMRLGEVLNLRWENIKDDKIILKRTETKQKKEKIIPITDGIRSVLDSLQKERQDHGYIFPFRRRSGIMRAGWADSLIRKIRQFSGIQDFIFHNIRHTASTMMISEAIGRGVGLADIMKVLGHSQIQTTLKYLHADLDRMKKAVEVIENRINKKG